MKNILNTRTRTFILSTTMVAACFASTAQAQPTLTAVDAVDDSEIAALTPAVVQPVVAADSTNDQDMFQFMVEAQAIKQMPSQFHATMPSVDASMFKSVDDGLGFSGKSTKVDVVSLKLGYMMGALPLLYKKDRATYNTQYKLISKAAKSGLFDAQTSKQMTTFLSSASSLNANAYTGMMGALSKSIAANKTVAGQRKHAYMLVGVWVTLNTMSLATNNTPSYLSAVGSVLAGMLEKDAAFGSSDKTLATHIRTIMKETKKVVPNKAAVYTALSAMTKVKKDA